MTNPNLHVWNPILYHPHVFWGALFDWRS